MRITTLIVGSGFHPPAKALLPGLPSGLKLFIVPEPDNPYDENALLVTLDPSCVPKNLWENIDDLLDGSGCTMQDLCDEWESDNLPVIIGHVAKTGGKPLQKAEIAEGNIEVIAQLQAAGGEYSATLVFLPGDGTPAIIIETPHAPQAEGN